MSRAKNDPTPALVPRIFWFLLVVGLAPFAALSQETEQPAETVEDEIVVTAQKREQNIQDVSVSVAVVSGELLEERALYDLEAVASQVPNFEITEAPLGAMLTTVRGLGTGAANPAFEQAVGTFVDGIYLGRGRQFFAPLFDVERVEVLRGPQSTLFGRNTIAGAINITSRRPTDAFEAGVDFLFEPDHGQQVAGAVLSGPLNESGTVKGRMAARWWGMDGWMNNTAIGGADQPESDGYAVRGLLQFEPSDKVDILVKLDTASEDGMGTTFQITDAGPFTARFTGFDPLFEDRLDGTKSTRGFRDEFEDSENENAVVTVDVDLSRFVLTSVTGYSSYDFSTRLDSDFVGGEILDVTEFEEYEQFSQELRITSPTGGKVEYIVGAYYQDSDLSYDNDLDAMLGTLGLPFPPLSFFLDYDQESSVFSLFGQLTFNVTDDFRLRAGLRYVDEDKDASRAGFATSFLTRDANPAVAPIANIFSWQTHSFNRSRSESATTPVVGVEYDVSDDVMLFASASEGFKGGGFVGRDRSNSPDIFEFEEETSTTYEMGFKTQSADRRTRFNGTLFHTNIEDLQVSTYTGVSFIIGNAAEATTQGLELEFERQLAPGVQLMGGIAYTDAEYDSFPGAATQVSDPRPAQDLAGQTLVLAPEWTGSLALTWSKQLGSNWALLSQVSANYRDDYFYQQDLDPADQQDAYTKVGARIALSPVSGQWEVAIVGRNLTDEDIKLFGGDTPFAPGSHFALYDRPRTVSLQFSWSWR